MCLHLRAWDHPGVQFPHEPTGRDALLTLRLFGRYLREPRFLFLVSSTTILVLVAAFVMRLLDSEDYGSFGLAAWWAVQTVTTVGYGDAVPHHTLGRVVAFLLMLVAIAFLAILTSIIASSFVLDDPRSEQRANEVNDALRRIEERLERLEEATSARKP
jgi:voltage-gated potassium channel